MGIETDDQARCAETGNQVTAGAHPVSATEQLAQLTLDALPDYMKSPGGIARFQNWIAVIVLLAIIAFGIAFYQMG